MIGNEILARALKHQGVETIFFLMGGPFVEAHNECEALGIRMLDVRHEQSAVFMAAAQTRSTRVPSVAMASSGPGVMNLVTGVAHAWADGVPLVVIGGASALGQQGMMPFQESDQVALFRPITKEAVRCTATEHLADTVARAFRIAASGRPGPVYVDVAGDVLYASVDDSEINWGESPKEIERASADPTKITDAVALLSEAKSPIVVAGSGVIWSSAEHELRTLVDQLRLPFYTTPMARGIVSEAHDLFFPAARSRALREADVVLQVGTRQNYIFNYMSPPRFSSEAKIIQIDIDPEQIGYNRAPAVSLVGDARTVLQQILARVGEIDTSSWSEWTSSLDSANRERVAKSAADDTTQTDSGIHPQALCAVVRDWLPEDAILSLDGHEILTLARQHIPVTQGPHHNSGTFGTMGVGLPYGLGAKLAEPDRPVVVISGDGAFGFNALELDTSLRHDLPVICVISNNGGWSGADRHKAGSDLGHMPYEEMFAPLGCFTRRVENLDGLRPALDAALASGKPAVINVLTDRNVRAQTAKFTEYVT